MQLLVNHLINDAHPARSKGLLNRVVAECRALFQSGGDVQSLRRIGQKPFNLGAEAGFDAMLIEKLLACARASAEAAANSSSGDPFIVRRISVPAIIRMRDASPAFPRRTR
jgi:hypothetical protein